MTRTTLLPRALGALSLAACLLAAPAAFAQASDCQTIKEIMTQRKGFVDRINALSKKGKGKLDPVAACGTFGQMVANGQKGLKWIEANKDWCQVPDQFAETFRKDHQKVVSFRGKACQAAAQMQQMKKKMAAAQAAQARARAQAQQSGGNRFGGGLTGQYQIPQGALPDKGAKLGI